jgi:hypothetical protein
LTSPHDPIISKRWRPPQANFNIHCERHPRRSQPVAVYTEVFTIKIDNYVIWFAKTGLAAVLY